MVLQDNFRYPTKGMKEVKRPSSGGLMDINSQYIDQARQMIMEECGDSHGHNIDLFKESSETLDQEATFFPASKEFAYLKDKSYAEQIEALKFQLDIAKRRMEKEISRCTKLEDKGLRILFGGYYKREE